MPSETKNRLFGLIGKDIDYSFSRNYFASKFEEEGFQNCRYENFDLPHISKIAVVLKRKGINGLNVTIPYKKAVMPYLDKLSEEAREIGAVNTICFLPNGEKLGHNTDWYGFEKTLKENLPVLPKRALILGTGGAALAVQFALERNGISTTCVSRNPNKPGQLAYEQLDEAVVSQNQLIVNTTPLGTFPKIQESPAFPYFLLKATHFLFDLIYNPEETIFLKKGCLQGTKTVNGYPMLVYQAEKSWELWNQ